jgi:hypothetical protein
MTLKDALAMGKCATGDYLVSHPKAHLNGMAAGLLDAEGCMSAPRPHVGSPLPGLRLLSRWGEEGDFPVAPRMKVS